MSPTEMIVVAGGIFLGYWIVSNLLSSKNVAHMKKSPPSFELPGATQNTGRNEDDVPSNWFRILEIPETASLPDIVAAYKRQISQYHPDKVAALGAELRDLAEIKSKQINMAYDYARKLRGQP